MYKVYEEPFGKFTQIRLRNEQTGATATLVPEFGSTLLSLLLRTKNGKLVEVIDGYQTSDELEQLEWAKSAKLSPFPNRLDKGKFTFEHETYQLPINFPGQGHAIHGFLMDKPFTMVELKTTTHFAEAEFVYTYNKELEGFPFCFETTLVFTLSENKLTCRTLVKNLGTSAMPYGDGWHPYFKLTTEKVDDLYLQLPNCQQVVVDENMIPTGEKLEYSSFSVSEQIKDAQFDTGFSVLESSAATKVVLVDTEEAATLMIEQENTTNKYQFLQVFIPPNRKSIAIEPMSCVTNAFNNHDGLFVLQPQELFDAYFSINLE